MPNRGTNPAYALIYYIVTVFWRFKGLSNRKQGVNTTYPQLPAPDFHLATLTARLDQSWSKDGTSLSLDQLTGGTAIRAS